MAKPIGRLWIKDDLISGYVVANGMCVKFGASHNNAEGEEVVLVYPSRAKKE